MDAADQYTAKRNEMVENQIVRRGIVNSKVLDTFRKVPRHLFVPGEHLDRAYSDCPLPIGHGQTISQPYIVALMTELLALTGEERVLEIGTGSGYQTAILAALAKEVYSVEIIKELTVLAKTVVQSLKIKNVNLFTGDGSTGLLVHAPYDRVIVTAAAPQISGEIKNQVADGGKIVVPMGERWQQVLEVWTRADEKFTKERILPVAFVPLRGKYGWQD